MSFDMLSHKAEGNVVKNKWLSFFSGKVQLELTGRGIERLLNECTRQGFRSFMSKRKKPYRYIYSFRMYMPFGG